MCRMLNEGYPQDVFQDETWNQCIERITYLEELIAIEEVKLFEAIKKSKQDMLNNKTLLLVGCTDVSFG
jgi:hypothetical protein